MTWVASSLVGVIINAVSFFVLSRKFTRGIPNAAVFPVPVCAVPKISFPLSATGIASACIGVGVLKLILAIESIKVCSNWSDLKFSIVLLINFNKNLDILRVFTP